MIKTDCYKFSFSGLKTHVTQLINKTQLNDSLISDIAYDFENAIIFRDQLEILERKSKNAKNK